MGENVKTFSIRVGCVFNMPASQNNHVLAKREVIVLVLHPLLFFFCFLCMWAPRGLNGMARTQRWSLLGCASPLYCTPTTPCYVWDSCHATHRSPICQSLTFHYTGALTQWLFLRQASIRKTESSLSFSDLLQVLPVPGKRAGWQASLLLQKQQCVL